MPDNETVLCLHEIAKAIHWVRYEQLEEAERHRLAAHEYLTRIADAPDDLWNLFAELTEVVHETGPTTLADLYDHLNQAVFALPENAKRDFSNEGEEVPIRV